MVVLKDVTVMAKDYWLIERKFKDGDKYFISEVSYSEINKFLKEVADFIGSYKNGIFQGDIEDFLEAILAHIESIATRNKRAKLPDINVFINHEGSYTLVGSYGSKRVFSMYCSKVKGTIQK